MEIYNLNSNNLTPLTAKYTFDQDLKLKKDVLFTENNLNFAFEQLFKDSNDFSSNNYSNLYLSRRDNINTNANIAPLEPLEDEGFSTYLAANAALAMIKEVFPGQRFVQAALTIAAGLANVAKIKATQFQGGGSNASNTAAPSGGSSTATPSATFSNPNTTMLGNQGEPVPQPQGSQPMRAYVVERDIQQTTSRVRRLSEFATLG